MYFKRNTYDFKKGDNSRVFSGLYVYPLGSASIVVTDAYQKQQQKKSN